MHNKESNCKSIIIQKEDAVFWMDRHGRWCNAHGPFQHKKIIDHFNASLGKDDNGYFVEQINTNIREKVYFRYVDTAVFAIDIKDGDPVQLVLNMGLSTPLDVDGLFIRGDELFQRWKNHVVKFSDRVLYKLSERIDCRGKNYYFKVGCKWRLVQSPKNEHL